MALRVGLTGGLACGKSSVLRELARLGAATVDADLLARQVLAPGSEALAQVAAALGPELIGPAGELDRAAVAELVFRDPAKRRILESIVHPGVIRLEEEAVLGFEAQGFPIVVVDAALLIEAGRAARFQRLVVVACSSALQIERAVARGMLASDAERRIAAQMPVSVKRSLADYVIDTDGSLEQTLEQTRALWELLQSDAEALSSGGSLERRK